MSDMPELPGKLALKNLHADRWIGHEDCCYVEHVIYRATDGAARGSKAPRAIVTAVERDLIVWSDLNRSPIYPVAMRPARARIQFPVATVCAWLDAGGREWILAALRPSADVIEFPGGAR